MAQSLRKRGAQPLDQEAQALITPPRTNDSSSAVSTLNESVQKPRKRDLIWNGIASTFGSTSERSTRASMPLPSPSPANPTQNDTTTSINTSLSGSNDTTVAVPKHPSRKPPRLGELLQREASNLWTNAYNELSIQYKQDLEPMGPTDSHEPKELEVLKQLLEDAMRAKRENFATQWILKWRGKEINVREKAEKLVGWITKFKEVVEIVVQSAPVHAALPWAGIRFILTVCLPRLTKAYTEHSYRIVDVFLLINY